MVNRPPRVRLRKDTRLLHLEPEQLELFEFPFKEATHVRVDDVWLEVDLPGDQWRTAFRLVPYAGQPVVAEVRLFPADHFGTRRAGQWRAEYLGVRSRDLDGREDPDTGLIESYLGNRFPAIRHGISGRLLRQIPLGIVQSRASEFMSELFDLEPFEGFSRATHAQDLIDWGFAEEKSSSRERPRRLGAGRPDLFYAQLAAEYVTCVESGSRRPAADLAAKHEDLSPAQVADAIHTARHKRGLLTRTTKQGRPGGHLTQKAEALLSEAEDKKEKTDTLRPVRVLDGEELAKVAARVRSRKMKGDS